MPVFLAALLGGLIQVAGTLVGRVLVSLGIGYVSFTAIDTSITFARDFVLTKIGALPGNAVAVASTMQIGTCVSILTSALVARMILRGMASGVARSMVLR